jgi:4-alpha-glucanotransferase
VGSLGDAAQRWIAWLAGAGQSFWQILPLVPVDEGGSPYSGLSALAGNPLLVDPGLLVREGLLEPGEAEDGGFSPDRVDFPAVTRWKEGLLRRAYAAFRAGRAPALRDEFAAFAARNAAWLDDYALFRALRDRAGGRPWTEWEPPLRDRDPGALETARRELAAEVEEHAFAQFLFGRQWAAVRDAAHGRGIRVIGDVPIFVAHDSADVWAHRDLFELDEHGAPIVVAGVPPDYFSSTGQRWGNPLYRWDVMEARGYAWWKERFRRTLELVDVARVDHFRGFESYWEVPASEETALHGRWMPGPGARFFRALEAELGALPLIAEDLGIITPQVEALRDELGFPGMRVLQFAFGDDGRNPHLPANTPANAVAYTGTHDNDTARGWWESASEGERAGLRRLTDASEGEIGWGMIETVFRSDAAVAIVPLQDVLGLGREARMNVPGTGEGNWGWRFREEALTPARAERLREVTRGAGRLSPRAGG